MNKHTGIPGKLVLFAVGQGVLPGDSPPGLSDQQLHILTTSLSSPHGHVCKRWLLFCFSHQLTAKQDP